VIVYVDSSVLARAYLPDENGHDAANQLLYGKDAVDGPVTLLRPDAVAVESRAIEIVRQYAVRSRDALHVAVAELAAMPLAAPETCRFASRDAARAEVAGQLGFVLI
jgi:predicted nucleic acid-binding protein